MVLRQQAAHRRESAAANALGHQLQVLQRVAVPADPAAQRALVLLPGGAQHAGRLARRHPRQARLHRCLHTSRPGKVRASPQARDYQG